jgi:beta-glucosidase
MPKLFLKFPDKFLWGASLSSHQVEGNNHNNWTVWEKDNAERLARIAPQRFAYLEKWNEIKEQVTNPQNYISGDATDHYYRYEEDFDLAKKLGMNAHRLSFEWSRIEPEQGKFNESEIHHYKKVIKALLDRNIIPVVTLWHWTFPLWVSDMGGWMNIKTVEYFSRYVQTVVAVFPEVKFWITLNEAEIFARESYLVGRWPPQSKSRLSYFTIVNNLATAHAQAYKYIKSVNPNVQVGIANNNSYFEPHKNRFYNKIAASILSIWGNHYFLSRVSNYTDFIGLNYYFHNTVNLGKEPRIKCELSDIGWEVCEYGIYYVLKELKRYKKPIYITENGVADSKDYLREGLIKDTLSYVYKAILDGVDVRGYLHWSLTDNFEWDSGFWPRFGLIEIDYNTQKRKVRESAWKYSEIIKNNGFEYDF